MKKTIFIFLFLITNYSFALGTKFNCTTERDDSYYVKSIISVEIHDQKRLTARPYSSNYDEWYTGSEGIADKTLASGWTRFSGFKSVDMFGDLSEGFAESIYIYVSPDLLAGKNGKLKLYARGPEAGREEATYNCQ